MKNTNQNLEHLHLGSVVFDQRIPATRDIMFSKCGVFAVTRATRATGRVSQKLLRFSTEFLVTVSELP